MRLRWTYHHDGSWTCRADYRRATAFAWSSSRRLATLDAVSLCMGSYRSRLDLEAL